LLRQEIEIDTPKPWSGRAIMAGPPVERGVVDFVVGTGLVISGPVAAAT
jgi:hypothetical protein